MMALLRVTSGVTLLVLSLVGIGCSCGDDEENLGGGGAGAANTGAGAQGGAPQGGAGGAAQGGAAQGGAAQGGAGGAGGEGGSGGVGFGPCHSETDDFASFDAASITDYWGFDGDAAPSSNPTGAVALTIPTGLSFAGLHTNDEAPASNCFSSIRVVSGGAGGLLVFNVVEGTGSGPMLSLSFTDFGWSVDNILDAMGNGENVATGPETAPQALRVQLLGTAVIFEAELNGTFTTLATVDPAPAWIGETLVFGFGQTNAEGEVLVVDDFNLDPPASM